MKIERINDNQIRCTLSSMDLSMRNLNLGELAYGSEKARNLFREMIQKASSEVGFEADDIPLMVEAIPLSNESVMLVITKIEDPEELDTRFSRFSALSDEEQDSLWDGLASELLEGADSLIDLLKKDLLNIPLPDGKSFPELGTNARDPEEAKDASSQLLTRIYRFSNLDQVMEAAKITGSICLCRNTLYKKPDTSHYYLVLSKDDTDSLAFSRLCNILAEYAEKLRLGAVSEAYFQEHYEVITSDHALQKLTNI